MASTSARLDSSAASAGLPLAGLVALLTFVTVELVRSSGPLLDLAYSRGGVSGAARAALVTYLAPGLVVAVLLAARRSLPRSAPTVLPVCVGLLALLRLVVQGLEGGTRFAVGLATVAVGVAALTLAVATLAGRPGGGQAAAGAVSAGAAGGVGLQLALGTWDAYWRHTLLGWSVTVAVVGSLVGLAVLVARDPRLAPPAPVRGLWALGPFLALGAMMLVNPAFAASQSGLPLALAGPVNALGLLLASWTVMRTRRRARTGVAVAWPRWWGWVSAGVLVLLVAGALSLGGSAAFDGVLVLLALLGAQVLAVGMLSSAWEPPVPAPGRAPPGTVSFRVAGAAGLVGLSTIVPLLAYQSDYDTALGVPNELVLVVTAAALGGAGLRRRGADPGATSGASRRAWRTLLAAAATMVLVGASLAGLGWVTEHRSGVRAASAAPVAGSGRVISWNVHFGVSPAGSVDLEATARSIEAQDPDVVLLQEVSRGWVQGGGVDMATWLSHRLGRQFAFAPAADRRFGNVILSRGELRDVQIHPLPYGAGPQNRSALSARVRLGPGEVRVVSLHLQQRRANTPTRIRELESLLADLKVDVATGRALIVGGDLNADPGWTEIALMTETGFVSAIDAAGDPSALTSPTTDPRHRIDWVFGRKVLFAGARVLVDARSSDHLPLVVALAH